MSRTQCTNLPVTAMRAIQLGCNRTYLCAITLKYSPGCQEPCDPAMLFSESYQQRCSLQPGVIAATARYGLADKCIPAASI